MVSARINEKIPSGDILRTETFIQLFTRDQRHVYYYIRSLVPNPADAEDILQQTSLLLWEKFDQFEPGSNFRAWACKIACFEVFNHRARQNRVKPLFSERFIQEVAEEADRSAEYLEARTRALRHCLERLEDSDQDLIDRRYRPGGTSRGAAKALGRPVRSVYKSLSRIRRALLECANRRLAREEHA